MGDRPEGEKEGNITHLESRNKLFVQDPSGRYGKENI